MICKSREQACLGSARRDIGQRSEVSGLGFWVWSLLPRDDLPLRVLASHLPCTRYPNREYGSVDHRDDASLSPPHADADRRTGSLPREIASVPNNDPRPMSRCESSRTACIRGAGRSGARPRSKPVGQSAFVFCSCGLGGNKKSREGQKKGSCVPFQSHRLCSRALCGLVKKNSLRASRARRKKQSTTETRPSSAPPGQG